MKIKTEPKIEPIRIKKEPKKEPEIEKPKVKKPRPEKIPTEPVVKIEPKEEKIKVKSPKPEKVIPEKKPKERIPRKEIREPGRFVITILKNFYFLKSRKKFVFTKEILVKKVRHFRLQPTVYRWLPRLSRLLRILRILEVGYPRPIPLRLRMPLPAHLVQMILKIHPLFSHL